MDVKPERWSRMDRVCHALTGRVPDRIYVQRMEQLIRDDIEREARRFEYDLRKMAADGD